MTRHSSPSTEKVRQWTYHLNNDLADLDEMVLIYVAIEEISMRGDLEFSFALGCAWFMEC